MAIAEELTRIKKGKKDIKTAVAGKGVTIPDSTLIDGYATYINKINVTPCPKSPLRELWIQNINIENEEGEFTITNFTDDKNLEYSLDESGEWVKYTTDLKINLKPYQKIYLRGDNPTGFNKSLEKASVIKFTKIYKAGGNIMSLISGKEFNDITVVPDYAFADLFLSESNLKTMPDVSNISVVGANAFNSCFQNSGITKGGSFTSLTDAKNDAFAYAFYSCDSITDAPDFPVLSSVQAKTFYNTYTFCTKLSRGGDYSSITKIDGEEVFYFMFKDSGVKIVKTPNITEWDEKAFNSWLINVGTGGIVSKPAALTIPTDTESGVPANWSTVDY